MKADGASFMFMLAGMALEVPFFQRGYVWDESNWSELIENLLDKNSSHYLGPIVLKSLESRSGEVPRWSIIDGQQRLTTLSILFKACCDAQIKISMSELAKTTDEYEIETLKKSIRDCEDVRDKVLFYRLTEMKPLNQIKIKHSHVDAPYYEKVVTGKLSSLIRTMEVTSSERILQCYKFFVEYLDKNSDVIDELFGVLANSNFNILVKIDLGNDENEQAIFDTVNSAGVRLTSADTIKNSIYQKAIELNEKDGGIKEEIIKLYEDTWKVTFLENDEAIKYWGAQRRIGRLNKDNLEVLLHSVALIKGFYEPDKHTMEVLPALYKKYIDKKNLNEIVLFINELCEYAQIFKKFFYIPSRTTLFRFDEPIKRLLHILEVCDITTFHAYILKLLKDYNVINDPDNPSVTFVEEIKKLETFVLRRVLCGTTTKNFNKICAQLLKNNTNLVVEFNNKEHPVDDMAVRSKLQAIYSNKIATLILFWIELYRRDNDSYRVADKKNKVDDKELKYAYTLEHVMPQKWETHWDINTYPVMDPVTNCIVTDIDEAEAIRRSAIYELGNMAMLNASLNSALKNSTIQIKVKGDGRKKGIEHYAAGIDVDLDVIDTYRNNAEKLQKKNPWNEYEIRRRTEKLENEFLSIWKAY